MDHQSTLGFSQKRSAKTLRGSAKELDRLVGVPLNFSDASAIIVLNYMGCENEMPGIDSAYLLVHDMHENDALDNIDFLEKELAGANFSSFVLHFALMAPARFMEKYCASFTSVRAIVTTPQDAFGDAHQQSHQKVVHVKLSFLQLMRLGATNGPDEMVGSDPMLSTLMQLAHTWLPSTASLLQSRPKMDKIPSGL